VWRGPGGNRPCLDHVDDIVSAEILTREQAAELVAAKHAQTVFDRERPEDRIEMSRRAGMASSAARRQRRAERIENLEESSVAS
jgi:hypothetical protein